MSSENIHVIRGRATARVYDVIKISEDFCEAQARVRQGLARDGNQGERPQSLNPSLELTLKLVATTHHHHHHPPTRKSHYTQLMARWGSGGIAGGKGTCVGSLWITLGSL